MTDQGAPVTIRQPYNSEPVRRRRNKLAPDPDVRSAILDAASKSLREQGVRGLSIAAVLERAQLSTRGFYRHFESKEQLVAEVLLEMARVETLRLRTKMANTTSPVEAVAAWIDGRLDRAFDENTNFKLRRLSQEARSEAFSSPTSTRCPRRRSGLCRSFPDALSLRRRSLRTDACRGQPIACGAP
jgi:AcrR family transcriptional regulator